jgi:beta-galactosidase
LTGTQCVSPSAILYDFDNESHAKIERFTGQQREASERAVYQALAERHMSADVRALSSLREVGDLAAYQIVFFPHAHVLKAADVTPLVRYVDEGGTLVFGCWSGYRDRNHWCYDASGKVFHEDFTGVRVADFTVIAPGETSDMRWERSAAAIEAPIFNEILEPATGEVSVLASYASNYYAGRPAVTLRKKGRGRVIYFGSFFTPQNTAALLDALAIRDPLTEWAEIPAEIQATVRTNETERFCFLLNFTNEEKTATFKKPVFDLLKEREFDGSAEITPYDVRLISF